MNDPAQQKKVVEDAKETMRFLQGFGARHLIVFPPSRVKAGDDVDSAFRAMCTGFNRIGEAAGEMGFQAGLHNHLDEMVQGPEEVDRSMALAGPRPRLNSRCPIACKGWICVDLDYTRNGPRASYEHCGGYITDRLEPIYA